MLEILDSRQNVEKQSPTVSKAGVFTIKIQKLKTQVKAEAHLYKGDTVSGPQQKATKIATLQKKQQEMVCVGGSKIMDGQSYQSGEQSTIN